VAAADLQGLGRSKDNWLASLVACAELERETAFHIAQPTDGLMIRLDPDLPKDQKLVLQAVPSDQVIWHSATLSIQRKDSQTTALLQPGEHSIEATRYGKKARVRITVTR